MKSSLVDRVSVERLLLLVGALRSGLIDALAAGDPLPAGEVARIAGADPRASRVMLEALAAEGIVERASTDAVGPRAATVSGGAETAVDAASCASPSTRADAAVSGPAEGAADDRALYRLSALGRKHLVDDGPELERFGLLHQANKLRGWLELPEVIRTGRPVPRDPAARDIRSMASAMGERDTAVLDEIVERCLAYAGKVRTMLDVGGAVGHVSRHFSRRGVQVTLLDRDSVIPVAREFLGLEGTHIALVAGDFTKVLPSGLFDLAYLGNVTHIYNPETNARVIREVFAILSPGGTIAIQDHVWGRSRLAALFAVNMLQATEDGGVWAESQYKDWLTTAGFVRIETVDLETTGTQLVLGKKPPV